MIKFWFIFNENYYDRMEVCRHLLVVILFMSMILVPRHCIAVLHSKPSIQYCGKPFGTVFRQGEDILLALKIVEELQGTLVSYQVLNEQGEAVASGEMQSPQAGSLIFAPLLTSNQTGWYRILFVTDDYIDIAILPNDVKSTDRRSSYFGLGYASFSPNRQLLPDFNDEIATLLNKLGCDWLKIWIEFPYMYDSKSKAMDWSYGDRVVEIAGRHDLQLLGVPSGFSCDASNVASDEECLACWERDLSALVRRYRENIFAWEVWNEPNSKHFHRGAKLYAELLKRSYILIKQEAPGHSVCFGGLTGVKERWLKQIDLLGSGAYMDKVAFHPYRFREALPEIALEGCDTGYGSRSMMEDIKAIGSVMDGLPAQEDGKKDRRLWVTESGYSTFGLPNYPLHAPVSEREQAALMSRQMLIAYANGVERFFWWKIFSNHGGGMGIFAQHYGDYMPKPAAVAYAVLKQQLRDADSATYISNPKQKIYGIHIYRKCSDSLALWTTGAKMKIVLPRDGNELEIINLMGRRVRPLFMQNNIEIELGDEPVFVRGVVW